MQNARRELRDHIHLPYEDESVRLHFVGDMLCACHSEIGYHRNPGFEVCLIPSGKGLFKIDGDMFPVENDHLFLTKTHQVHGGWPSSDAPFRILYLCFSVREGSRCQDAFWAEVHNRLTAIPHPVCSDHENLQPLYTRLMREITVKGHDHERVILHLLKLVVVLLLRNYEHQPAISSHGVVSLDVIRYIDAHLDQALRLTDIATAHHQSVSALTRRFRRETGFSVMEYCHMARLEKAKTQLGEAGKTVSDIAISLHFGSIHHFSHAFKAVYGVSPSGYRKRLSGNEQP